MRQGWLLIGLLISSGIAFVWPEAWWSPLVASKPWLGGLIAATMFAVGCLLPVDEIRNVGKQWPLVLAGTALQYTVMPTTAYLVARAFDFDSGTLAGMVLVGCVPGAMASNVLTLLARGNTSYSVCLTTLATLASPVAVPAALSLALSANHQIDFLATSWLLVWQVVLPVFAGFLSCRISRTMQRIMEFAGPFIANLVILWIIAAVVALNKSRAHELTLNIVLALLLINVLGYLAGYYGGAALRIDEPMRRALTLEVGMQNCGLGTTMALSLFPGTTAAIPTAVYTFGCMLTGAVLATWWSRLPPQSRDVPISPTESTDDSFIE